MTGAGTAIPFPLTEQPGSWLDSAGTDPESARQLVSLFPPNAVLFRQSSDSRKANLYEYQIPLLTKPNASLLVSFKSEPSSITELEPEMILGNGVFYSFNTPNVPITEFRIPIAEFYAANTFGLSVPALTPATAVSNFYGVSIQNRPIVSGDVNISSITAPSSERIAEARFASVFRGAAEERFEDGMESAFSRNLESTVRRYGLKSFEILTRLLADPTMPASVWAEAMRWLGRADDALPLQRRLWLLEKGLTSPSASVRDGALLGLSSIDDASAIPYVERAIAVETIGELRADMRQLLAQLRKSTRRRA
jgi:hypothetical protein